MDFLPVSISFTTARILIIQRCYHTDSWWQDRHYFRFNSRWNESYQSKTRFRTRRADFN